MQINYRARPICMPYTSQLLKSGNITDHPATIIGWGRTAFNGASSDHLLQAELKIVDQESCAQAFKRFVTLKQVSLCAGVVGSTKDSCQVLLGLNQ